METLFMYILPIGSILFGLYLSFKTDILKDTSNIAAKPYSFSRTQLMWWSLIIIASYSHYYGIKNEVVTLHSSLLVILGISLGTSAIARVIDTTEISNNVNRHQDHNTGKNFLFNILSDKDGVSIHRFQALLFNVIFGIIFITHFLTNEKFYEFSELELALLGISSSGYIGLKINENKQ